MKKKKVGWLVPGLVWLGLIVYEIFISPTLSQFAWHFGRKSKWFKILGIGLVALLAVHLLKPMWKDDPPPTPPEAPQWIIVDDE